MLFAVDGRLFLSTPSARRATCSPAAVYGYALEISIHALREEGDAASAVTTRPTTIFLSTPSARRATLPLTARAASS